MTSPLQYPLIAAITLVAYAARASDAADPRIISAEIKTPSKEITQQPDKPATVSSSPACSPSGKTRFFDDKLPMPDWDTSVLPAGTSTPGYASSFKLTGGNPAEFRRIEITLGTNPANAYFAHVLKGNTFDPAKEGAVVSIDGAYDLICQLFPGVPPVFALLLYQDGVYFRGPSDTILTGTWSQFKHPGLKATDFVNLGKNGPQNPVFSCEGKPIQIGFVVLLEQVGQQIHRIAGIDNWSVSFNSTCCSGQPITKDTAATTVPNDAKRSIAPSVAPAATVNPQGSGLSGLNVDTTPLTPTGPRVLVPVPTSPVSSRCCCDDDEAVVDNQGTVIAPPNLDPDSPPVFEYVDQDVGDVADLYPGADTSVDTWVQKYPCKPAIGGTVPNEADNPNIDAQLVDHNINATYDDINKKMGAWEKTIADKEAQTLQKWKGPLAPKYVPPPRPYSPPNIPGRKYAFGGRDIIFVHGLKLEHILDRIKGNPDAQVNWQQPASFPASTSNPAFYTGYYKNTANPTWIGNSQFTSGGHIYEFLRSKGYFNRYLVVSYNCSERLDVAVKAVLAQIGDAMVHGVGVVDPGNLTGPPPTNFGTPSFVIVSHSTGGLVTDVALTVAAKNTSLQADYIPKYCKAHIAAHGAHRGSKLATAAIVLSGYSVINPPPWVWQIVREIFVQINPPASNIPPTPTGFQILANSVLLDLVPTIAQSKWGSIIRDLPVRTLTVVGAHPTFLQPLKFALLPGFDDGVANIDSQVANPNNVLLWPGGFRTDAAGLVKNFDMGVFGVDPATKVLVNISGNLVNFPVNIVNTTLNSPNRAINYYVNQKIDRISSPLNVTTFPQPFFFASGATPYISPTGMLQTIAAEYGGGSAGLSASPLNRNPNIFSYLQSASDHFKGTHDQVMGFNGVLYGNSPIYDIANGEGNFEETRVITDPAIYATYTMPYGDNQPLLRPQNTPTVKERIRGLKVTFTLKLFKKKWTKHFWVWKRRYHLLDGSDNKRQFDYVYESVLKD
jgi:hypothetical protein